MDKQRFIKLVQDYYNGVINKKSAYELIYSYCIARGKEKNAIEIFINFITSFNNPLLGNMMNNVIDTIIKDWGIKYEITEIHKVFPDGRTKIIKIY